MSRETLLAKLAQLETLGGPAEVEATELAIGERIRQIVVEKRSPGFDDTERTSGELAAAAACYAHDVNLIFKSEQKEGVRQSCPLTCWPFPLVYWKPASPRRMSEKAVALMLAELSREIRAGIH